MSSTLKFCIKPVDASAVLKLASIAMDYSPLFLIREVAEAAGFSETPLHPLWISSFVHAGVQIAAGRVDVKLLKIEYHRPARQGAALILEVQINGDQGTAFEILDKLLRPIASGTAQVSACVE